MRMLTRDEVVLCHHNADGRAPLLCSASHWEACLRQVLVEKLAEVNGKTVAEAQSLVDRHGAPKHWTALDAASA